MPNNKSRKLFDRISRHYGRFYNRQRKNYSRIFKEMDECNLSYFSSILDIGCGSGAMASVFAEIGLKTYAVDQSTGMLRVAKSRRENGDVDCFQVSGEDGLPFSDNSIDIVIAAHVAHGMKADLRMKLYGEMKRVAKHLVILHDYKQARSLPTTVVEFAEGGDYFNFIKVVKEELRDYFGNLEVVNTEKRSCCYVCHIG